MKVPLPKSICAKIAQSAVDKVQQYATERRWKSSNSFSVISDEGIAGVKTSKHYLMYQEQGTDPHLIGREGQVFKLDDRFVTIKGRGQPGMVVLPGGVKVFRQEKWKHPGLKPQHFMLNALEEAVGESQDDIKNFIKGTIGGVS